jgi:Putative DNA-binding domain
VAQLDDSEIVRRIVSGSVSTVAALQDLFDRSTGRFSAEEGLQLDYKERMNVESAAAVAELSKDILGFSNTDGGVLILGVDDGKSLVGHDNVDFRRLSNALGLFIGTRVDFEMEEVPFSVAGRPLKVFVLIVRRSLTSYPNLLRKDIELRPNLVRKIKYVQGTLFYRSGSRMVAEPPSGDLESRARDLGFSGSAPRTATSFLLSEDRPGLRLYAPINDRFFGRRTEIAELEAKFDDARGRGVSIAGFGGVGKTELAIRLVSDLYRRGKFQNIYSGSAKQSLLGPTGAQQTDPVFIDLRTFLDDLSGWLGFNSSRMDAKELESNCLQELAKLKKVLIFVDNLETVTDRELFIFLDNKLPSNCWLIATARVHRIRNFVFPKELREMEAEDAAHLLRYELKRQGLKSLADSKIDELQTKARSLFCHPLAIRWFAWACRKNPRLWTAGIEKVDLAEIETFCVAHTLGSLDVQTQRVLGAILAASGVSDADQNCVIATSGLHESFAERALWELECSGLVHAVTDDNGTTTYTIARMAEKPTAEMARKRNWEAEYVQNLKSYVRQLKDSPPDSPLIRDLVYLRAGQIQSYSKDEKQELIARISRALPRCPERHSTKLKWLKAECHRHLDEQVSADDLYRECAESLLSQGQVSASDLEKIRLLLEAATVAKARAQTDSQIRRAISYLHAVEHTEFAHLRVLGMLTEYYAILGDRANYEKYLRQVTSYSDSADFIRDTHRDALQGALERARGYIEGRRR